MSNEQQRPRRINEPPQLDTQLPAEVLSVCPLESIRNIYAHFGREILCPAGSNPSTTDFAATATRSYQEELLAAPGISVCLTDKGDLCCIACHSVAALKAWQGANPALMDTLTTFLPDGSRMFVWLRISPRERPADAEGTEATWHGEAGTIQLTRGFDFAHLVMCPMPPRKTSFNELNWSFSPELEFCFGYGKLLLGHGTPTLAGANGNARLNTEFWAAMATRELGLKYDRRNGIYLVPGPEGVGDRAVPPEWVERAVERLLLAQSLAPGCEKLTAIFGPRELREVRDRIAVSGAIDAGGGHLSVEQYVQLALTPANGGAVTSQELLADYQRMCREMNATILPDRVFCIQLKQAILSVFGIGKSSSIRRPDGQKNGYRGLRLKLREG